MRVAVIGAGAVGTFLGAVLAAAGEDVILVGRDPAAPASHVEIVLHERDGTSRTAPLRRAGPMAVVAASPPDVAVLAVRQPSVDAALDVVAAWPAAAILTIQNGIGAEEAVLVRRPGSTLVAGSLTSAVEPTPDGVRRLRAGGIALATVSGPDRSVERGLGFAFRAGGLRARHLPEWRALKWSKLLANLVGNATSALLDADPATIYADPRLFDVERRQLLEALAVMDALGVAPIALPGADVRLLALAVRLPSQLGRLVLGRVVGGARGGKSPSLRLHLARADPGRSEAGWLNGAVASAGDRLAVPTPVNRALARLVDEASIDPDRRASLVGRPDRLLDAI